MKTTALGMLAGLTGLILTQAAFAQQAPKTLRTGEQVYNQACAACHTSGVANAPKFKDVEAWKPLIAEGQHILTSHAFVGVRAMPAKGGVADLKVVEFANAVAYMARNAGADWKDADAAMLSKIGKEGSKRIDTSLRELGALKRELTELSKR